MMKTFRMLRGTQEGKISWNKLGKLWKERSKELRSSMPRSNKSSSIAQLRIKTPNITIIAQTS
jgi:hypothetical protein